MALTLLDVESGSSISKYLKKSFKKYDVEKRKEMSIKECLALIEDLYDHTGLEVHANWDKKALESIRQETSSDTLTIPMFCAVLMASRFWEGMEKKGNLKAKKLVGEDAKVAIAAVIAENDGFLEPMELGEAYQNLAERLDKPWSPDALQSLAEMQLRHRSKRTEGPIQMEEFLNLCIAGPYRHFELKPAWWSKLGKKKAGRDALSMASTPRSIARSSGDMDDTEYSKPRLQRVALHYTEGWLVLVYQDSINRLRMRRLHLKRHIQPQTDCQRLAQRLVQTHGDLIPTEHLQQLLQRLQQNLSTPLSAAQPSNKVDLTASQSDDEPVLEGDDADFNKVDEKKLKAIKAKMDLDFEKKRIKPGDPNWKYRVDLDVPPPVEASGWDSDS